MLHRLEHAGERAQARARIRLHAFYSEVRPCTDCNTRAKSQNKKIMNTLIVQHAVGACLHV